MQIEVQVSITRKVSFDKHPIVHARLEQEVVDDRADGDSLSARVQEVVGEVVSRVAAQLAERQAITNVRPS